MLVAAIKIKSKKAVGQIGFEHNCVCKQNLLDMIAASHNNSVFMLLLKAP
jgi:hypothetical protein